MSENQDRNYSYNPFGANFTFNGNNTNYYFIRPGVYNVDMSVHNRGNSNPSNSFRSSFETTTNVMFPYSKVTSIPARQRSNRIAPRQGFGLNTISEEGSPFNSRPSSPSSVSGSSSSSVIFEGTGPSGTNQARSAQSPMTSFTNGASMSTMASDNCFPTFPRAKASTPK